MPVDLLYPTPIFVDRTFDENIFVEIQNAVDSETYSYNDYWGKTHELSKCGDILKEYECHHLQTWLEKSLKEYYKSLNQSLLKFNDDFAIESWIAKFNPDDYAHIHSHGHADISGVFYHQTNCIDGDLWFENPTIQSEQSLSYTQEVVKYTPEKGKLIMFPGYMKHGVLRNQTEDTRISLSFNIYFPKKTA
tara:strand:- start:4085 stop:4657 length:573 start_codon:yes stop_codon:yes gene_type:complete